VQITNHNNNQSKMAYYDSLHVLISGSTSPITLSNTNLPTAGIQPGAKVAGWIDFAVPKGTRLDTLTLQIGSAITSESLVDMPMKAPFDASRYTDKTYPQNSAFSYNWNGHILQYHLTSVGIRYAYQGNQAKVGQQFYLFNFAIDNPNTTNRLSIAVYRTALKLRRITTSAA
jgi:hypothetical protein